MEQESVEENSTQLDKYTAPTSDIISRRLDILPGLIKDQEIKILNNSDLQSEAEYKAKLMKQQTEIEVREESGSDGKPKYKNEGIREIETETRLRKSEAYVGLMNEITARTRKIKEQQIEHRFLENRLSAAKSMARMKGGELND